MSRATAHDAKTTLSELLRRVEAGEEIIITRGQKPVAVLSAYKAGDVAAKRRAAFNSLAGQFKVPPDDVLIGPMSKDELEAAFGGAARKSIRPTRIRSTACWPVRRSSKD